MTEDFFCAMLGSQTYSGASLKQRQPHNLECTSPNRQINVLRHQWFTSVEAVARFFFAPCDTKQSYSILRAPRNNENVANICEDTLRTLFVSFYLLCGYSYSLKSAIIFIAAAYKCVELVCMLWGFLTLIHGRMLAANISESLKISKMPHEPPKFMLQITRNMKQIVKLQYWVDEIEIYVYWLIYEKVTK